MGAVAIVAAGCSGGGGPSAAQAAVLRSSVEASGVTHAGRVIDDVTWDAGGSFQKSAARTVVIAAPTRADAYSAVDAALRHAGWLSTDQACSSEDAVPCGYRSPGAADVSLVTFGPGARANYGGSRTTIVAAGDALATVTFFA